METTTTTKTIRKRKPVMITNCKEALENLKEIEAAKGERKLNKLGEWLLSEDRETWIITDMRAVMK